MRTRHIRQKFLLITIIILFSIFFPMLFTTFAGNKWNAINVYKPKTSSLYVTISNSSTKTSEKMDLEYFLPCAIMGQLSVNDNEELLKSFIIIMRTYICNMLENEKNISADALSIPYMTYDEMEALWKNNFADNLNKLNKLVCETSLLVITNENSLIQPYYHSCSNGKTRAGREPYLKSVDCTDDTKTKNFTNTIVYSKESFQNTFQSLNGQISLSDTTPLENLHLTDENGYITNIQIDESTIDVSQFINVFELASQSFQIDEYNGGIRIITKGSGHGYGVSLSQARALSQNGASYSDILNYFYQNIQIKSIFDKSMPQNNT